MRREYHFALRDRCQRRSHGSHEIRWWYSTFDRQYDDFRSLHSSNEGDDVVTEELPALRSDGTEW